MKTLTEKNLKELKDTFNIAYNILYDNPDLETYKLVEFGENCLKNYKEITSQFIEYRRDFLISDRELAAYGLALKTLGLA